MESNQASTKNISWDKDLYQSSIVQRNILIVLNFILGFAIIGCLMWIQMMLSQNQIEPFVIEIDKKTGQATTIKPITLQEYSANTAVIRSLVINYIKAREEYIQPLFDKNFSETIRLFSSPGIYYTYKSQYSKTNPQSPFNVLGKNGTISIKWKSIIFPEEYTAQVRISVNTQNATNNGYQVDKIILMSFAFDTQGQISEEDRLINPLGFTVTMYKIESENPNM